MTEPNKQLALQILCILLVLIPTFGFIIKDAIPELSIQMSQEEPYIKAIYVSTPQKIDSGIGGETENLIEIKDVDLPKWAIVNPIEISRITQKFTSHHLGIDLVNDIENYNVSSIDDGRVIFAGWSSGYGYRIEIEHNNGMISAYSHLKEIKVSVGDQIKSGQYIGEIGLTGKTLGLHLHFEILYNGIKIDPNIYLK